MRNDTISRKKRTYATERQVRKNKKKIKPLSAQTPREKEYTREFLSYPDDWNYTKRIKAFTEKYGYHQTYAYKLANSLDWKRLIEEKIMDLREEMEIERVNEEIRTFEINNSFTDLSELIKQNTSYSLIISNGLLKHSLFMMEYYAQLIEEVVSEAEGVKNLQAEDRYKIESYDKKINAYKREIQFMLPPTQISTYLKMLGISDEMGGTKEGDEFSVTPDTILRMLEEIHVSNKPTTDEMIKAVGRESALSVEVNGRVLADVDMSERKKERFKKIEDEKSRKSVKH